MGRDAFSTTVHGRGYVQRREDGKQRHWLPAARVTGWGLASHCQRDNVTPPRPASAFHARAAAVRDLPLKRRGDEHDAHSYRARVPTFEFKQQAYATHRQLGPGPNSRESRPSIQGPKNATISPSIPPRVRRGHAVHHTHGHAPHAYLRPPTPQRGIKWPRWAHSTGATVMRPPYLPRTFHPCCCRENHWVGSKSWSALLLQTRRSGRPPR